MIADFFFSSEITSFNFCWPYYSVFRFFNRFNRELVTVLRYVIYSIFKIILRIFIDAYMALVSFAALCCVVTQRFSPQGCCVTTQKKAARGLI